MGDTRDNIIAQGQAGGGAPDFVVTTQLIKEMYEASQVPGLRYGVADKLDAGKTSLLFSGAPVEFDPNCATGELYMLPSENIEFVVHSDYDWEIGEFQKPPQQDVYIAQVIWRGNLVTNNRRRLGKNSGITA